MLISFFLFCFLSILEMGPWMLTFLFGTSILTLGFMEEWSLLMLFLSGMIMIFVSASELKLYFSPFIAMSLVIVFSTESITLFYSAFEICTFLIFIAILGWGYQPERLYASFSLFLYAMISTLPFSGFIFLCLSNGIFCFWNLHLWEFSGMPALVFLILISFFVKMPVYIFHSWLPKAHVEASASGSIILAGILLKLGSYGAFKFLLSLNYFPLMFSIPFSEIFLWGSIVICFICLRQIDMKKVIAYSSVSHMSMMGSSMLLCSKNGMDGSLLMSVSHGIISSSLFFILGLMFILNGNRTFLLNVGIMAILPMFSMLVFSSSIFNFGIPPSINFVSELLLLGSIFSYNYISLFPLGFLVFGGAIYSIFFYSNSQIGRSFKGLPTSFSQLYMYLVFSISIFSLSFLSPILVLL